MSDSKLEIFSQGMQLKPAYQQLAARLQDLAKRTFDLALALLVLFFCAPLFSIIALAIHRDTPGPVFYRSPRLGRKSKAFKMLKFRTMYETPASYLGPKVTAQDDPRITPLGHWLRATKLNELPQFWNVLKGEMSLVGPRPEDPAIAMNWPADVRREILSVRPGITSPASIEYRNEEGLLTSSNLMDRYVQELAPDKIRLDQLYIRHRSLGLDLDVLLWTFLLLLPRLRAYPLPEQLLFVGPFTRLLRRYLNWFTIDFLVTLSAIGLTAVAWRFYAPLTIGWSRAALAALCFALTFSLCGAVLGVNRIRWALAAPADLYDLLPAWGLAVVITTLLNHALEVFPTALVLCAALLALSGYIIVRYRSRLITGLLSRFVQRTQRHPPMRQKVLIIGSGSAAQHAAWLLDHPQLKSRFQLVGFVDNDLFKQGMRIYGARVVGTDQKIAQLVKKFDIGLVLVADQRSAVLEMESIRRRCENSSALLLAMPDLLACLQNLTQAMIPVTGTAVDEEPSPCQYCLIRLAHLKEANQAGQAGLPVTEGENSP